MADTGSYGAAGGPGGERPRRLGVQPFERDMVRDHLDRKGLRYFVDQDGDFRIDFAPFSPEAPSITVLITAAGPNEDILMIQVIGSALVEKTMWDKVLRGCNQWNMERRFPKAFLYIPQDLTALSAQIFLEGEFPLAAGVTQPMVDDYVEAIIGSGVAFWEWALETGLLEDDALAADDE